MWPRLNGAGPRIFQHGIDTTIGVIRTFPTGGVAVSQRQIHRTKRVLVPYELLISHASHIAQGEHVAHGARFVYRQNLAVIVIDNSAADIPAWIAPIDKPRIGLA